MAVLLPISTVLSPERALDVVFVHGLGGDPLTTWRSGEDESSSWPHWLAEDKEFGARIGVWSLGYATANPLQRQQGIVQFFSKTDPEAGTAMPLPMRAVNALDRLAQEGIGQRPVCFITHSLGGLLVKSILRRADESPDTSEWRRVAEQCRGVLFLATPHHGSWLADLVNAFRCVLPTVSTDDLRDNEPHLMELFGWYRDHAPSLRIRTFSYFETKPCHPGGLVVKQSSADPGVSGPLAKPPIPLDRDHLEICKPRDCSDLAYLGSIELIKRILQEASSDSTPTAAQPEAPTPAATVLVRSFLAGADAAETVIDLSDLFICADSKDRRPKDPNVWTQDLPVRLPQAVATIEGLPRPVELAIHAHLSIAWYLGTLLKPNRGPLLLRQRFPNSKDQVWDCSEPRLPEGGAAWEFERIEMAEGRDLALVVSPTHDALRDAQQSIRALGLGVSELHHALLASPSRTSIQDGAHARWLANELATTMRAAVVRCRPGRVHLFAACPVSLAFLLGQQADLLGPTTVYEFSFGEGPRLYFPGMATGL
ncbi:MAG: SAVED domain-containing protein [Cyanobacteriota bacterium]